MTVTQLPTVTHSETLELLPQFDRFVGWCNDHGGDTVQRISAIVAWFIACDEYGLIQLTDDFGPKLLEWLQRSEPRKDFRDQECRAVMPNFKETIVASSFCLVDSDRTPDALIEPAPDGRILIRRIAQY